MPITAPELEDFLCLGCNRVIIRPPKAETWCPCGTHIFALTTAQQIVMMLNKTNEIMADMVFKGAP